MTIKDIARLSGCGVGTVSRVLNDHPGVSEGTRRRVMAVVEEYGFQPNSNARCLKRQAGTGIAIIARGRHNILFLDLVERLQVLLRAAGRNTSVHFLDEEENEVAYARRLCREAKHPGVIFLGGNLRHFREGFQNISTPCLMLTNSVKELGFPNISSLTTDDEGAAAAVIRFLAGQGHRAIGVLAGCGHSEIACQRLRGCQRACRELGLDFDPQQQSENSRYSLAAGYAAAMRLMGRRPDLTAVFAVSDAMAMGAIRALHDMGRRVPEDVSVMGFDGIPLSEYFVPRLATVRQDTRHMAERGVEVLLDSMEGGAPFHELVPFQLAEGESVARAAAHPDF